MREPQTRRRVNALAPQIRPALAVDRPYPKPTPAAL